MFDNPSELWLPRPGKIYPNGRRPSHGSKLLIAQGGGDLQRILREGQVRDGIKAAGLTMQATDTASKLQYLILRYLTLDYHFDLEGKFPITAGCRKPTKSRRWSL